LGKVIETNSYVVFLRMGSLAALLLRQYIEQHKTEHTTPPMERDLPIQKINHLPIPVSLIVSSSDWHFSFTENEGLNSAHVSEIVRRIMRIACLPAELLEENECSLDKLSEMSIVECQSLYDLNIDQKADHAGDETQKGKDIREEEARMYDEVPFSTHFPCFLNMLVELVKKHNLFRLLMTYILYRSPSAFSFSRGITTMW
jgi:hypothetical protein